MKNTAKRRYALPASDAEIVRLALRVTLQEMAEARHQEINWVWYKAQAEELLHKLENYKWEV